MHVTHDGDVYRASVYVRTEFGEGERVLEYGDCAAAAEASALVIAVAATPAGPQAESTAPATPPAPPLAATPTLAAPSSPDMAAPVPTARPSAFSRWRLFRVGAGMDADAGSLPSVSVGPTVMVAVRPSPAVSIEAAGGYGPTQTVLETTGLGGRFDRIDVSWRGCYERPRRLAWGSCIGWFVNRVHGEGVGGKKPSEQIALYSGPIVAGSARVMLTDSFSLRLLVEGAVLLSQPSFVVLGVEGTVYRSAPICARGSLAAEVTF